MSLKLVFTASLLKTQHYRDSVKNKPASLLVVPLGKALYEIPPSLNDQTGGRQPLSELNTALNRFFVVRG